MLSSRHFFTRLWSWLPKRPSRHVQQRILQLSAFRSTLFAGAWFRSRKTWKSIAWPSLGLVWAKCEGLVMEDLSENDPLPIGQLEMNEAAALTHTSLLRQASGLMTDASLQLLHRTVRAIVEFSAEYRKQLNSAIDLLEYCTATLKMPEHHDHFWEQLIACRSEMESLKQQIKDLNILTTYAYTCLESAAMAAYINGSEFAASSAQQAIDSAKLELETNTQQTHALEILYNTAEVQYIEASQKVAEEKNTKQDDDESKEEIDNIEMEGEEIMKDLEEER